MRRITNPCLAARRQAGQLTMAGAAVAAVIALTACSGSAGAPSFTQRPAHPVAAGSHAVLLSRGGLARASLEVLTGAASISVTTAAMPGELLRVTTPSDSQLRPQLTVTGGKVQLFLAGTGLNGPAAVSVQVSSGVTWQFQFSGGASQTDLDMTGGKLAGIDFTAGCNVINLTLPRPDHTVTLTLAGGSSQVSIAAPAGVPARLQLDGGASLVRLAGASHTGVAGGTVLAAPGWPAAADRYDVLAPAGVSMISVSASH